MTLTISKILLLFLQLLLYGPNSDSFRLDQNKFKNIQIHGGSNSSKKLLDDLIQPRSKDEHNFTFAYIESTTSSLYVNSYASGDVKISEGTKVGATYLMGHQWSKLNEYYPMCDIYPELSLPCENDGLCELQYLNRPGHIWGNVRCRCYILFSGENCEQVDFLLLASLSLFSIAVMSILGILVVIYFLVRCRFKKSITRCINLESGSSDTNVTYTQNSSPIANIPPASPGQVKINNLGKEKQIKEFEFN